MDSFTISFIWKNTSKISTFRKHWDETFFISDYVQQTQLSANQTGVIGKAILVVKDDNVFFFFSLLCFISHVTV